MIAAYILIGAIGGFLGFAGALALEFSFWSALLLYPLGGGVLIVLTAIRQLARRGHVPAEARRVHTSVIAGRVRP